MQKILIILPYFGRFPNYFPLFLQSCRYNPTINWLLLTDNTQEYDYPENINVVHIEFSSIQTAFQQKFDFPIVLHQPYKLCDYRPAYGYLFSEYLNGYDFWGHCDLDLIFGDLRAFFPDEQLAMYDKVGHLGHLTLYRNTPEINTLFMATLDNRQRYREVFTTEQSCIFDEWDDLSINQMFLRTGKRLWLWNDFFDAYPHDDNLVRATRDIDFSDYSWTPKIDRTPHWISWEDGNIFSHTRKNGSWEKEELAYAHFQKRDMSVNCLVDGQSFWCLPSGFVPMEKPTAQEYILAGNLHRLINRKRWKQVYQTLRYRLIVATAPIRQKLIPHLK
ncbi:MAG: hypothetical protein IJA51_03980 [Oscillospiraceae bacterium]|nr:hypothetical protein [Oscillospiraceae bacterium]